MNNSEIKLKEGCGRDVEAIHIIQIPKEHPRGGWYRQMVSLSAFRHRALDRWCEYWHYKRYQEYPKAMIRFHDYDKVEEQIWKEARDKYGIEYPEPQEIHHDSLWDFYDHIGYNHKDKRVGQIDRILILNNDKSDRCRI